MLTRLEKQAEAEAADEAGRIIVKISS